MKKALLPTLTVFFIYLMWEWWMLIACYPVCPDVLGPYDYGVGTIELRQSQVDNIRR